MTGKREKIIEVRGLKKTYGGEKKRGYKGLTPTLDVLKGIDIDIYRGDVVCLISAARRRALRQVHLPAVPEPAGKAHRRHHQI